MIEDTRRAPRRAVPEHVPVTDRMREQVIGRLGDVFGVTVNRASRLTGIAAPGTVVSDEALAGELRPKDGFVLRKRRRRRLRGVGDVVPWVVSRPPAALTR